MLHNVPIVRVVDFMHSYRTGMQSDAHEFLVSTLRQLECDAGYVLHDVVK